MGRPPKLIAHQKREALNALADGTASQADLARDMRAHTINDELGALDFDVATNSQGLEVKSFTVKTLSRDPSHASVVANLTPDNWVRHSDRENEILYDLVWERGRWRIDDIHSVIEPNAWSLRTILMQYLAR